MPDDLDRAEEDRPGGDRPAHVVAADLLADALYSLALAIDREAEQDRHPRVALAVFQTLAEHPEMMKPPPTPPEPTPPPPRTELDDLVDSLNRPSTVGRRTRR